MINMMELLEVEAGAPVTVAVEGDGRVISGVLPAGRYATVLHVGHPDGLVNATQELLDWAAGQGLTWDVSPDEADEAGERWGCRLEIYLTDPTEEPDMNKWETRLAFRLAD